MGGMNMGAGMDMGGGKPGKPGKGGGSGASMGMNVDVDVTTGFDVAAGRLVRIEGTQVMDQSMGGMGGMKVRSRFSLQRL